MRLLVLSDLHVEVAPFAPPAFESDVVVLAGDIHNGARAPAWARECFPRHPIVQIAGNHEFYDHEYGAALEAIRAAARQSGVHFLENDEVVIDGVRFLGCTLWTDYRVFEAPGREPSMDARQAIEATRRMNPDHHAIRVGAEGRAFAAADSVRLHEVSRDWLTASLARPFHGPTVVVTHHLPSWRSVHPAFARWASNAAFVSNVDPLLERSDYWIHGHTHASFRYRAGRSELACNPRGYPVAAPAGAPRTPVEPVFENPAFDPAFVLDVAVA